MLQPANWLRTYCTWSYPGHMLRRPLVMHAQNDIPVFFIRDGIKFVDLVHSLKPSPKKHVQEGWRVLDFLSHHPESCNIVRVLPCYST